MISKEILEKVIIKAEKNGYKNPLTEFKVNKYYELIIFSHDFAKAFWGEEVICTETLEPPKKVGHCECILSQDAYTNCDMLEKWEYHLQQMILEKEPLKYLEQFLHVKTS